MPPKQITQHAVPHTPEPPPTITTSAVIAIALVTLLAIALTLMAASSLFGRLFPLVMGEVTTTTQNALKLALAHPDGLSSLDFAGLFLLLFPALAALSLYALAVGLIAYIISRQFLLVQSLIRSGKPKSQK